MPTKVIHTLIILGIVWVFVIGAGVYMTMVKQPEEMARVEKAEKVVRLKQAELASLMTEQSQSAEKADQALRKWQSRYKVIPQTLESPEVIGYLNELTASGFEVFDVTLSETASGGDYQYHSFSISGRGYFSELYRIVWELENNRYFYRIPDLTLVHMDLVAVDDDGLERMKIMVSFQMQIDAIFGGAEGMSAPEGSEMVAEDPNGLPVSRAETGLPRVPKEVLPSARPAINPFFPLIMDNLPPNTYGYIDLSTAKLVSVAGDKAIFQEGDQFRSVGVGDDVYLGQIMDVDPIEGRVRARLNKGGIIDEVEIFLQSGERSERAQGAVLRAPSID